MIRLLYRARAPYRQFTVSLTVLKKKASGGSSPAAASSAGSAPGFDSTKMKDSLESMLRSFTDKVKEAKAAAVNTSKFDDLKIDLGHGSIATLKSLATVAARGNKINIVAFDPKQVKRIQSAIISELGLPAEPSAQDKQTVSVTIPQQTEAKKTETAKLIKEAYDSLRNNNNNRDSLASIRAKFLNPLKKAASKSSGVSKDDVKRQTQEIEQLLKTYSTKLQDMFRKEQ